MIMSVEAAATAHGTAPQPVGVRAGRATARLAKTADLALQDVDLSVPQYRLLAYLSEGTAAATALAERLIVSRPSVTALVDGLVQRGLVERQPDAADRRRIDHVLTDEGRDALAAADAAVEARLRDLAAHLGGRAEDLLEALATWADALDAKLDAKLREPSP